MVHDSLARFDEAREDFEAALAIAREAIDTVKAGSWDAWACCTPIRASSTKPAVAWMQARLYRVR